MTDEGLYHKKASVYNPSDPLEKAAQESYHKYNSDWLFPHSCKLFARAITALKSLSDSWLDNPQLLDKRIDYFFSPIMTKNTNKLVFVTHLIFVRDILENNSINSVLHSPVVFMTIPIAHFLFREYPVHLILDGEQLNNQNQLEQIGGLFISDGDINVKDCLLDIQKKNVKSQEQFLLKAATTMVSPGVFKVDEQHKNVAPNYFVYNKNKKKTGKVLKVDSGSLGNIYIQVEDNIEFVSKQDFDLNYIII